MVGVEISASFLKLTQMSSIEEIRKTTPILFLFVCRKTTEKHKKVSLSELCFSATNL